MIKVEIEGVEDVQLRMAGMQGRLGDLTPAWAEVHKVFMRFEQELFNSEGDYVGTKWKPLSPRYAAWKLRRFGSLPILRVTGELMKSFTTADHPGHVYRATPDSAEMGSRNFKARYHQVGTLGKRQTPIQRRRFHPRTGMPARPPLKPFSRVEGQMLVDIMLAHVLRGGNPT